MKNALLLVLAIMTAVVTPQKAKASGEDAALAFEIVAGYAALVAIEINELEQCRRGGGCVYYNPRTYCSYYYVPQESWTRCDHGGYYHNGYQNYRCVTVTSRPGRYYESCRTSY